MEKEMLRHL